MQQAGIREAKPEQDEGDALLKAINIHYVQTLVNQSARLAASSLGPGALAKGQGHQKKGRAGCPTPSWYLRGRGGSADGASRYKTVERIL